MKTHDNITEIYNQTAREHYLRALLYILGNQEEKTGYALNTARATLLDGRHFSDFRDEDVKKIMPHLSVETFNRLYGDFGSKSKTRWIRDPQLLEMIRSDILHLSPLFRNDDPQTHARTEQIDGPAVRLVG